MCGQVNSAPASQLFTADFFTVSRRTRALLQQFLCLVLEVSSKIGSTHQTFDPVTVFTRCSLTIEGAQGDWLRNEISMLQYSIYSLKMNPSQGVKRNENVVCSRESRG